MDLKKRLANLEKLSHKKRQNKKRYAPEVGGATDRQFDGPVPDVASILQELGFSEQQQTGGSNWSCEFLPAADLPAPSGFPDLSAIFTQSVPDDLRPEELLFLDTETTGLSGGTGTFAFLIGLAWWTRDGFVVRQLFLPGPGRETPMLLALADIAANFRAVVTFNGNGFDLPLLRTRELMSRLPNSLSGLVSWDLLPAVRRLWRLRLPDCRQQTIETRICGRERGHGDIDGALIPQIYFHFLREGQSSLMQNVLTHNHRDMLGMGEIFNAVVDTADDMSSCRSKTDGDCELPQALVTRDLPWQDAWSRGRIFEVRRDRRAAAFWLTQAVDRSPLNSKRSEIPERFFADAIRNIKRTANWNRVEMIILAGLTRWPTCEWLHREAAILYEHRLGRLHHAYQHAKALDEPGRIARLEKKLDQER